MTDCREALYWSMKTITLEKAIELLENAAAIILPDEAGSPLMYPSVDKDEEEFLSISWADDEALDWGFVCLRGDNAEVEIRDNALVFVDEDKNEVKVQILVPQQLS